MAIHNDCFPKIEQCKVFISLSFHGSRKCFYCPRLAGRLSPSVLRFAVLILSGLPFVLSCFSSIAPRGCLMTASAFCHSQSDFDNRLPNMKYN